MYILFLIYFFRFSCKFIAEMPGDKTHFKLDWINPQINLQWSTWLAVVKDDVFSALCNKCHVKFSLSNMGVQAVKSHESSAKHKRVMESMKSQVSMDTVWQTKKIGSAINVNIQPSASTTSASTTSASTTSASTTSASTTSGFTTTTTSSASSQPKTMTEFVVKKEVIAAEILWVLRIIMKLESYNSCKDDSNIFKMMFPDSTIATNFSMGPDKASYLINYGLSPYFQKLLIDELLNCEVFVVCFDEALNKIAQKGQMDLHVRFWCDSKREVCTRYLQSLFLCDGSAENLLQKFKEGLGSLSITKLLQVSMDGPAVNWKFIKLLKLDLDKEPEDPKLLEIGSCGLHVVNGALQTGHTKVGWQVNQFLRGLYYLFKDSPTRRAKYTNITESNLFPMKFCQIRWVENVQCVERAMVIFESIKKYIASNPKLPANISIKNVKLGVNNSIMLPQLAFFKTVAADLQPFLVRFQAAEPLSPYLYSTLFELVKNLMNRFVKSSVLQSATTVNKLIDIDLKNTENLLLPKDVDIGFGTARHLNKCKATDNLKAQFQTDCCKFLVATVTKILERCPLKYNLTQGISCLDPDLIFHHPLSAQKRMNMCLKVLHENFRITEVVAERAKQEFLLFCTMAQESEKQSFQNCIEKHQRLDSFFCSHLRGVEKFNNLWKVVKIILIISHGNASVEGGFSINKGLLVTNLHEDSIISQRHVYDAVMNAGGIMSVNINDTLLQAMKGSRSRWTFVLEQKRLEVIKNEQSAKAKKRQQEKIKELQSKKAKLNHVCVTELKLLDTEIAAAQNILNNMD